MKILASSWLFVAAVTLVPSSAFSINSLWGMQQKSTALFNYDKDTPSELPSFASKEEYEAFLMEASGLPSGFSIGSAVGSFVPLEAPAMGSLKIKGTIIHLPDGPTDNWGAVFTSNKVGLFHFFLMYFINFRFDH